MIKSAWRRCKPPCFRAWRGRGSVRATQERRAIVFRQCFIPSSCRLFASDVELDVSEGINTTPPLMGFEPTTFELEVQRAIRCATAANVYFNILNLVKIVDI